MSKKWSKCISLDTNDVTISNIPKDSHFIAAIYNDSNCTRISGEPENITIKNFQKKLSILKKLKGYDSTESIFKLKIGKGNDDLFYLYVNGRERGSGYKNQFFVKLHLPNEATILNP